MMRKCLLLLIIVSTPVFGATSVTTTRLSTAFISLAYTATLKASGGTAPYTWTIGGGSLPVGLALSSAGVVSGTTTASGNYSVTVVATDSLSVAGSKTLTLKVFNQPLDQYGGMANALSPNSSTGFFRTEKDISGHWRLVTPDNHYMWANAVYYINDRQDGGTNYTNTEAVKYSSSLQWGTQAINRMKDWGFNAIGPGYSTGSHNVLPIISFGSPANPSKVPFYGKVDFSSLCLQSSTYQVKNLYANTRAAVYSVNRIFPDVFDPAWTTCADASAIAATSATPDSTPWLIGMDIGDTDYLFGLQRGNANTGHPHLGWIALITSPIQTTGPKGDFGNLFTYTDTTVYTKVQWQTFLTGKYGTVGALNAAWGSTYTVLGASPSGWPKGTTGGTGLLDEDGSSSWVPNCSAYPCTGGNATVQADMDEFLASIADQYYSTTAAAIHAAWPNHLAISNGPMQGFTYASVMQKAGLYLDLIEMSFSPLSTDPKYIGNLGTIYTNLGKPIIAYTIVTSPTDSQASNAPFGAVYSFCDITHGNTGNQYTTQELRGQCYGQYLERYRTGRAPDGTYPVLGIVWWAFIDKVISGENANFGLVSQWDNTYDGLEDQIATANDSWGFATGNELADHGNFMDAVTQENLDLFDSVVRSQMGASLSGVSASGVTLQ